MKGKKPAGVKTGKWYWNWFTKHIYMAAAAVAVVVFCLFWMLDFITRHNQELEIPTFMGLSVEEAQKIADANSFRLEVTDSVHIPRMQPGAIYKQNPQVGSKVKKNRRILLTINAKSPKMVKMPSLAGYSLRQAQSELASSQLKVGKLIYVPDLATNNVLEQLYKGRPIEPGREIPSESIIDLKVGLNAADSVAIIPDLLGKPYAIIKDYLIDNSLNLGEVFFDNTVTNLHDSLAAFAYRQELKLPENDSIPRYGTAVSVYFTLDKSLIPVKETEETDEAEEER
ncbi:MAG: PASTA domain-containing protein [Bacteroidales bacterium]|nr:PASTA domain-containing protein [Bacteroidales bacterium]